MKTIQNTAFLGLMTICVLAPLANASTLAITFTGGTSGTAGNYSGGWDFTVLNPVTVVALDYYNVGADNHDVALISYDPTDPTYPYDDVVLAQATVTPSDPTTGPWSEHALATPIVLTPGTSYSIYGLTQSETYVTGATGFSEDPNVNYQIGVYYSAPNSGLQVPDSAGTPGAYQFFGPNFEIASVPEPSFAGILFVALLLLAGARFGLPRFSQKQSQIQ